MLWSTDWAISTAFFLTAGESPIPLEGADALLPHMQAETLLADKAFDADQRVIEPLLAAGKQFVIPPKSNRKVQRTFDREMYKARHLMENFFCKLKQYRAIARHALRQDRQKFPRCDPLGRCYHLAQLRTGSRTRRYNLCRPHPHAFPANSRG